MTVDETSIQLAILKGNYGYTLITDALYWFTHDGRVWQLAVPEGFQTDLASLPRVAAALALTNADPRLVAPAILHDYLYRTGAVYAVDTTAASLRRLRLTRREKDDIFYQKLLDFNLPKWKAFLVWLAVRMFGWM